MTDIYGWPYFNPEVVEAECFPIEHDIEYVGGIRVHRVTEFKDGATRLLWACEHGQSDSTPEGAAANCVQDCKEEPMFTNKEIEIRSKCRIETLEELASLTDNGLVLDSPALREMASECRRAMMAVSMLDAIYPIEDEGAYPVSDPKHPEFHSTHADLWDLREKG